MKNQLFFAALMLATGIGIPVMAALSSTLGARYGSPAFAASVLFLLALSISVVFLFVVEGGLACGDDSNACTVMPLTMADDEQLCI